MQKVRYRGTPIFGDGGEEYVKYLPGEKRYVGEPSDEIDEAWNELTTSELVKVPRRHLSPLTFLSRRAILPPV